MTAPTLTCLCGATYTDNADGRLKHKQIQQHAPSPGRRVANGDVDRERRAES